jgi:hypothetical protein
MHHVQSDPAESRVLECLGDGSNDLEPERLPQTDRDVVGLDDGVAWPRTPDHGPSPARIRPVPGPHPVRAPQAQP